MKFPQNARLALVLSVAISSTALAATCPNLKPSYPAPTVGDGWEATLIAQDLTFPRGIIFDSKGALLVVESGAGVSHLALTDGGGGCITVASKTTLISSPDLNHGIALSKDGKTLYASTSNDVFAWTYDASGPSVGKTNQTIVTGMTNDDHTTRTLLMSTKEDGMLLVSRGSNSNIDIEAENIETGHSQIRAFNVNNVTSSSKPYEFINEGRLLGWGLRNSVGVAEEPLTGGIYSVENSADDVVRDGVDIHQNNPGEEMNFHGFLNASTENQGGNYGYPYCFAVWNTSIPNPGNLTAGSQFTLDQNATINDDFCASERVPPRLTFQAHMAPLDIIFFPNGTEAFVSFHGSWDRTDPVGYKVVSVRFNDGVPIAAADSTTATTDIFANANNSVCPDSCFRPVGLELDSQDRMFVSSDATGEVYVLVRTSATSTSTGSAPSSSPSKKSDGRIGYAANASTWILALVAALALL